MSRNMAGNFFSQKEISCRCGCGLNNFSPELLLILNRLRESLGRPVVLNSASRCENRDRQVKLNKIDKAYKAGDFDQNEYECRYKGESDRKRNSSHIKGLAADIRCSGHQNINDDYVTPARERDEILRELFQYEAPEVARIGIGPNFVHIDLDHSKPQGVVWLY